MPAKTTCGVTDWLRHGSANLGVLIGSNYSKCCNLIGVTYLGNSAALQDIGRDTTKQEYHNNFTCSL